jgi:hypothetical protein
MFTSFVGGEGNDVKHPLRSWRLSLVRSLHNEYTGAGQKKLIFHVALLENGLEPVTTSLKGQAA